MIRDLLRPGMARVARVARWIGGLSLPTGKMNARRLRARGESVESARRFLERGIDSFILFAELSNPTLGFYDRMGGERLLDARGRFHGAFGWRDARVLLR